MVCLLHASTNFGSTQSPSWENGTARIYGIEH